MMQPDGSCHHNSYAKSVDARSCFFRLPATTLRAATAEGKTVLRGKLASGAGGRPALRLQTAARSASRATKKRRLVLRDRRLLPTGFRSDRQVGAEQVFEINPDPHGRPVGVQDGQR